MKQIDSSAKPAALSLSFSSSSAGLWEDTATVVACLEAELRAGIYPVGSRFPNQNELCQRFKVTRPTIGKIVARLAAEGWVVSKRGAGTFVLRGVDGAVSSLQSHAVAVMWPFDDSLMPRVQGQVLAHGFVPCLYAQTGHGWQVEDERKFLVSLIKARASALIAFCAPRPPYNEELLEQLAAVGCRIIHVEPYAPELPGQSFLLPDYRRAGRLAAVDALLAGARGIGIIRGGNAPYQTLSAAGFAEALEDHGAPKRLSKIDLVASAMHTPRNQERLAAWLSGLPSAATVFCQQRLAAERLFEVLRQLPLETAAGIRVIVLCFDRPVEDVTSIVIPHEAILHEAIEAATAKVWQPVRRLVPPILHRQPSL